MFCRTTPDGKSRFERLKTSIELVVGMPCGWYSAHDNVTQMIRGAVQGAVQDCLGGPVRIDDVSGDQRLRRQR